MIYIYFSFFLFIHLTHSASISRRIFKKSKSTEIDLADESSASQHQRNEFIGTEESRHNSTNTRTPRELDTNPNPIYELDVDIMNCHTKDMDCPFQKMISKTSSIHHKKYQKYAEEILQTQNSKSYSLIKEHGPSLITNTTSPSERRLSLNVALNQFSLDQISSSNGLPCIKANPSNQSLGVNDEHISRHSDSEMVNIESKETLLHYELQHISPYSHKPQFNLLKKVISTQKGELLQTPTDSESFTAIKDPVNGRELKRSSESQHPLSQMGSGIAIISHEDISDAQTGDKCIGFDQNAMNSDILSETIGTTETRDSEKKLKDETDKTQLSPKPGDNIEAATTTHIEAQKSSGATPSYKQMFSKKLGCYVNSVSKYFRSTEEIHKKRNIYPYYNQEQHQTSNCHEEIEMEEIHPLYGEKVKKYQASFGKRNEDLIKSGRFLHDTTIDEYFKLLINYALSCLDKKVVSLDVTVFKTILSTFSDNKSLESLNLDLIMQEINSVKPDFLLIPVHRENNHYQLFIIQGDTIEFYDSLACDQKPVEAIKEFIRKTRFYGTTKSFTLKTKSVPKQTNKSDCGVFVCLNARFRMEEEEFTYPNDHIQIARNIIWQELKEGTIFPSLPFDSNEVSKK